MNIFRLSIRNMTSRPLGTLLSLVLLTLSVGLISLLFQVNQQIQTQMDNNIKGIDMVVGAKGSPLQLILSAVYHIDAPTGNIRLFEVKKLQKNRLVKSTIPLSYGDSYKGYRIVGTHHDYIEHYNGNLKKGQLWQKPFEVILGATVAQFSSLKVGDTFSGQHGLLDDGIVHDEHTYIVVGILDYSNSVLDQLILTASESVWKSHHHEEESSIAHRRENESNQTQERHEHDETHKAQEYHDAEHEADEEITALLVKFRSPVALIQLPRMVNETTNMQAAVPAYEISRLYKLMGVGMDSLRALAFLIMLVSALSVFISLFNALKERKFEMALMRTYGASRWQLVWLVIQEGLLLSVFGFFLGAVFSRIGLLIISNLVSKTFHYQLNEFSLMIEEIWLLVVVMLTGLIASLLPAVGAFRIDISKTLSDA